MTTEKDKMLSGVSYDPRDADLMAMRIRARDFCRKYNASGANEKKLRRGLSQELLGAVGQGAWIEPPFQCDYGSNIYFGDSVYLNYNCVILDVATVRLGNHVMLAPGVQLLTAQHPVEAGPRRNGVEFASPITLEDDVWIGGGVIVCPGVTIGARSVIGAGSVVTKDIPADVVAAGNPCRVIRHIDNNLMS